MKENKDEGAAAAEVDWAPAASAQFIETATFAAGCFWGAEAAFSAHVGAAGGTRVGFLAGGVPARGGSTPESRPPKSVHPSRQAMISHSTRCAVLPSRGVKSRCTHAAVLRPRIRSSERREMQRAPPTATQRNPSDLTNQQAPNRKEPTRQNAPTRCCPHADSGGPGPARAVEPRVRAGVPWWGPRLCQSVHSTSVDSSFSTTLLPGRRGRAPGAPRRRGRGPDAQAPHPEGCAHGEVRARGVCEDSL